MKPKKQGFDNIHTKKLKQSAIYIKKPLECITNLIIEKSIWSHDLKSAEIKPVYKTGIKNCWVYCRPISLISQIFDEVNMIEFWLSSKGEILPEMLLLKIK